MRREIVFWMKYKKTYSFECKKCKIITFIDFEKIANEKCVFFLKQRVLLVVQGKNFMRKESTGKKGEEILLQLEK